MTRYQYWLEVFLRTVQLKFYCSFHGCYRQQYIYFTQKEAHTSILCIINCQRLFMSDRPTAFSEAHTILANT